MTTGHFEFTHRPRFSWEAAATDETSPWIFLFVFEFQKQCHWERLEVAVHMKCVYTTCT